MIREATASNQGTAEPLCGSALATDVSKWAYHDGWPLDMETRVEPMESPARLAGSSHNTADSVQKADQAIMGAMLPNGPDAAADDGIPGATSAFVSARACAARRAARSTGRARRRRARPSSATPCR